MANNPKKVKDPTEVALSAIQEALNISDAPSAEDNARGSVHSDEAATGSPSPDYNEGAFSFNEGTLDARPGNDRPAFEPVEEPRAPRRAANDDRETIGQLLQAIQKGRPARSMFTVFTVVAAIWLAGCALLTFGFLPSLHQIAFGRLAAEACCAGPCKLVTGPIARARGANAVPWGRLVRHIREHPMG